LVEWDGHTPGFGWLGHPVEGVAVEEWVVAPGLVQVIGREHPAPVEVEGAAGHGEHDVVDGERHVLKERPVGLDEGPDPEIPGQLGKGGRGVGGQEEGSVLQPGRRSQQRAKRPGQPEGDGGAT